MCGTPPPQRGQRWSDRRDALVAAALVRPPPASFADRSLSLRQEFLSTASAAHGAFAKTLDFQNQPEAAAAEVNAFIAEATRGSLRDLVQPGTFQGGGDAANNKIVLANAMHFKATWARRFDPSDTERRKFHRLDGTSLRVPFLSDPGKQYAASFDGPGLGFKVLQCFYKMVGRDGRLHRDAPLFSMLVFLPHRRDGLADLLRLAVSEPDFVMRCAPRREQVVRPCLIPKFKFSFRFDASGALRGLGVAAPFDKLVADLSGTVGSMPPEGRLCVSAVEVDEEGTTAVGATYACVSPTYGPGQSTPPPKPMSFVADHPFLFAVVEYGKGEVLFLGHVVDPSKQM